MLSPARMKPLKKCTSHVLGAAVQAPGRPGAPRMGETGRCRDAGQD